MGGAKDHFKSPPRVARNTAHTPPRLSGCWPCSHVSQLTTVGEMQVVVDEWRASGRLRSEQPNTNPWGTSGVPAELLHSWAATRPRS